MNDSIHSLNRYFAINNLKNIVIPLFIHTYNSMFFYFFHPIFVIFLFLINIQEVKQDHYRFQYS